MPINTALDLSLAIQAIAQLAPLAGQGLPFAEAVGGGSCPELALQFFCLPITSVVL